jgi:kinesin family protein 4/21/27
MIACIAPIDIYTEENISTLNYAARAGCISNAPHVNMDPRLKTIGE